MNGNWLGGLRNLTSEQIHVTLVFNKDFPCQDYVKLSRIVLFCKPNRKISPATLARVAPWELGTVSKHYGMNERKKHMASEFVNLCRSD